jgi:methylglyoxal synthase
LTLVLRFGKVVGWLSLGSLALSCTLLTHQLQATGCTHHATQKKCILLVERLLYKWQFNSF